MESTKRLTAFASVLIFGLFIGHATLAAAPNPKDLVAKAEKQVKGNSFEGLMKMVVQKNGSERTLEMKSWLKGDDQSLIRILNPAKDRGSGTLRVKLEMWQFLPNVNRIVKIPPSMMLQSWMGSDFSNDDLVKSTSLARDYTHKLLGQESVNEQKTYKIECIPKPKAAIVWGKVIIWVREKDQSPVKQEFYSERGQLIKTLDGTDFKTFGKRTIPTKVVMTPNNKPGQTTTLIYEEARFDHTLPEKLFTENQLRSELE